MSDATITQELPLLTWRGLSAPPYDTASFKWKNRLAAHTYPYVDVDSHDPTGRDSMPLPVRLYFVNTTVDAGSLPMRRYPEQWEQWRDQLLDGAAGDLQHPALGLVRARVSEVGGVVESKVRSGIVVDVTWLETNEDPSVISFLGDAGLAQSPTTLAANADALADGFGVTVAPGRLPVMFQSMYGLSFPSGFTAPTLSSIFSALRGSIFAAALSVTAQIQALMGDVAAMVNALEDLGDVTAYFAIDACIAFWTALRNMAQSIAATSRPTKSVVVGQNTYLDAFARQYGNSVAEIMALNAGAISQPYAPRGTSLSYYVSS